METVNSIKREIYRYIEIYTYMYSIYALYIYIYARETVSTVSTVSKGKKEVKTMCLKNKSKST